MEEGQQVIEIQMVSVNKLTPYKKNPRKNDAAVDPVAASIKEFGFLQPITVDKNWVVITGHTRLLAAKKLGLKEVPVIYADKLSETKANAYRLADNKSAEFAEWIGDMLIDELKSLAAVNYDMEPWFPLPAEEPLEDTFDVEAALEDIVEPITKRGDIWLLDKHRLMCGDSTNLTDVENLMRGDLADMVFTDPPWNVNYGAVDEDNEQGYRPRTLLNDFMGTEDFKTFMYSTFYNMNLVSKGGCMTYVVMSAQEWGNMMLTILQNGYHWSSTIIWNKDHLVLSRKDYHTKYEPIWYGWKEGTARLCPLDDRKQSDVWDINRPIKSDLHPTTKPVELCAKAIENSSKKGDLVLDLFGGSGSTLIAAEQTGRACNMMELDPKYCDVICKRYENLTGVKVVRIYDRQEALSIPNN